MHWPKAAVGEEGADAQGRSASHPGHRAPPKAGAWPRAPSRLRPTLPTSARGQEQQGQRPDPAEHPCRCRRALAAGAGRTRAPVPSYQGFLSRFALRAQGPRGSSLWDAAALPGAAPAFRASPRRLQQPAEPRPRRKATPPAQSHAPGAKPRPRHEATPPAQSHAPTQSHAHFPSPGTLPALPSSGSTTLDLNHRRAGASPRGRAWHLASH